MRFVPKDTDTLPEIRIPVQTPDAPADWKEDPFPAPVSDIRATNREMQSGMIPYTRMLAEPVYPETVPRAFERTEKLRAFGTPGQFVTLNFVVHPLRDLKNLKVRVVSPAAISADAVQTRLVAYWKVRYPIYKLSGTWRRTPEYLFPATVTDAPAGEGQRWLVTVKIPDRIPAGIHRGKIHIFHDDFEKALELPWELEVFPFRLKRDPKKHFSAYYRPLQRVWKKADNRKWMEKAVRSDLKAMKDYGFTRLPLLKLDFEMKTDRYKLRWNDTDLILSTAESLGLHTDCIIATDCGLWYFYRKYIGREPPGHLRYPAEPPQAMYDEMKKYLDEFLARYRAKNYPPLISIPVDEPFFTGIGIARKICRMFQYAGVKTVITSCGFKGVVRDVVDYWSDQYFNPY